MPIRIHDELPAVDVLRRENVFVMTTTRASRQEIRPLKVLLLNLMPKKIETENQILRLLSNSSLQLDIQLLRIDERESKNTPAAHLDTFYCRFEEIQTQNFDGLIITGAPLGQVPFDEVIYWPQLQKIIAWAKQHVTSTLFLCWAAQAALNVLYDLPKITRTQKLSGVYRHQIADPLALLTRGFDDSFLAPHSRFADFPVSLIKAQTDLMIYAHAEQVGAYLMATADKRMVFVTGHPEYDAHTLANEYTRDVAAGLRPVMPVHYFPNDDATQPVTSTWRSHAYLLFSNWLNYYVYQITPYDLREMNPTLD